VKDYIGPNLFDLTQLEDAYEAVEDSSRNNFRLKKKFQNLGRQKVSNLDEESDDDDQEDDDENN
jgi:hypothetical protein